MSEKKNTKDMLDKAVVESLKEIAIKMSKDIYACRVLANAIDLINRLQSEKKELQESANLFNHFNEKLNGVIAEQKAKIERLNIQIVQGLRDMKLEVGIREKEIERLEEENEKLKTLVSHFEQLEKQLSAEIERLKKGQAESAKTAVEVLEQNIELQKQVGELKAKNEHLESENNRLIDEVSKLLDEGWDIMDKEAEICYNRGYGQAVKDTAKKYDDFIHALICKYNSDIGDNAYGNMHREAKEFAQKHGVEVE